MKTKTNYCFSFDAETNGLWGQAFAIAAVVTDSKGKITDKFEARLPDSFVSEEWVKENVLPALNDMTVTHSSYTDMLSTFAEFYHKYRETCAHFVVHMGYIVETKVLRDMHELKLIGDFEAPYPLLDISGNLQQAGFAPDSVDDYAEQHSIKSELKCSTHHPLYDSDITAKVFTALTNPLTT